MPLIAVKQLKKSFSTRLLFENVSFEVQERDHIGLVGVNGCGKTTLFRILRGEEAPDTGSVFVSRDTVLGCMAQTVSTEEAELTVYDSALTVHRQLLDMEQKLNSINARLSEEGASSALITQQAALNDRYEYLGGLTFRNRTRSTLMGLGFSEQELQKPLREMSGGQRNKVQLAKVLLSGANMLLLDEPTNHLDINAIAWLEDFLASCNKAFIVISHDRYFLDKVTNRIIELKNCHITLTPGNYSRHIELISDEQEMLRRKYAHTQKEIRRIQGVVDQQRRWGQEHNFITAASKLKQIERLRSTLVAPEKDTSSIRFRFRASSGCGNDVLIAEGLAKRFEKQVFSDADLHIQRGERAFLLGANGCGKTTLLNIIAGRISQDAGCCTPGAGVRIGYYEQTLEGLSPNKTVLSEVWDAYPKLNTTQVRSALAAFLFGPDDIEKTISLLSGGEKARVQLLKLMLSGANFLLLDEPTNHLDIASRDALESALEDYDGTMLIVTHDRYLVNRLADRVLQMTQSGIREYIGGYDDFLLAQNEPAPEAPYTEKPVSDYKLARQRRSEYNQARGELNRCEKSIEDMESELAELTLRMQQPEIAADYVELDKLAKQADALQADIKASYDRAGMLEERINTLKQQLESE